MNQYEIEQAKSRGNPHKVEDPQQNGENFSRPSNLQCFHDDEGPMSFLEMIPHFFRVLEGSRLASEKSRSTKDRESWEFGTHDL